MTFEDALRKSLKEKIKEKNFTFSKLAIGMNTSQPTISRILNGPTKLNLDDAFKICEIIGSSFSSIAQDVEKKFVNLEISYEVEKYVCSNPKIWALTTLLNFSRTKAELCELLQLSESNLSELLSVLLKLKLIQKKSEDVYSANSGDKSIYFGRTPDFYNLKSTLYKIQSDDTIRNLGKQDYWKNKDDSLIICKLSYEQSVEYAKKIEQLISEMRLAGIANLNCETRRDIETPHGMEIFNIFFSMKPFNKKTVDKLLSYEESNDETSIDYTNLSQ